MTIHASEDVGGRSAAAPVAALWIEAGLQATALWVEALQTWGEACLSMTQANGEAFAAFDLWPRFCALHLRNAGLTVPLLNDA